MWAGHDRLSLGRSVATTVALRHHACLGTSGFSLEVQQTLMDMPFDGSRLCGDKADSALKRFKDSLDKGLRPILDFRDLNLFLKKEKFKMLTLAQVLSVLDSGDWMVALNAYFHIPILPAHRRYLRFVLLHYVKNVRFKNKAGAALFFSQTGKVPAQYDVVNWHRTANGGVQSVRIGTYDSTSPQGQRLINHTSAIQWPSGYSQIPVSVCSKSCMPGFRKAAKEGKPVCCFLCIPRPPGEISNQTDDNKAFKKSKSHESLREEGKVGLRHLARREWSSNRELQRALKSLETSALEVAIYPSGEQMGVVKMQIVRS
ncbi:uncharacterized protein [Pleurodeles waltl]|uniref:uncharacterized protein n=1 Tax=Pleurodeles waltl TaxID=8319 RepID=UPI00370974CA